MLINKIKIDTVKNSSVIRPAEFIHGLIMQLYLDEAWRHEIKTYPCSLTACWVKLSFGDLKRKKEKSHVYHVVSFQNFRYVLFSKHPNSAVINCAFICSRQNWYNKLYSILMSTVEQLTANDPNISVRTSRNPNKQTKNWSNLL